MSINSELEIHKNFLSKNECDKLSKLDPSDFQKRWIKIQEDMCPVDVVKFNVSHLPELRNKFNFSDFHLEILKYKTGAYMNTHTDVSGQTYGVSKVWQRTEWTMTGTIILNNDFTGGELVFDKIQRSFGTESMGDLILFPAGINSVEYQHRVNTVLSGERISLVLRVFN